MPLMSRVRVTKGSLFLAWSGSESSFACCHCQEIASVVHSASFSSSNSSSDIELHVSLAVNQMFRSFTCDLRKCESPRWDLHGWLNIKHPSTFFSSKCGLFMVLQKLLQESNSDHVSILLNHWRKWLWYIYSGLLVLLRFSCVLHLQHLHACNGIQFNLQNLIQYSTMCILTNTVAHTHTWWCKPPAPSPSSSIFFS